MSDYIKRKDARQAVRETCKNLNYLTPPVSQLTTAIDKAPSADVVEVVRCKDCIHNDQCKHRVVMWEETPINTWHKDIDFCSYGKEQDNE